MPYDLSKPLVIGISSRALFNLEQENKIFEEQGVEAYEAYQVAHENEILQRGFDKSYGIFYRLRSKKITYQSHLSYIIRFHTMRYK